MWDCRFCRSHSSSIPAATPQECKYGIVGVTVKRGLVNVSLDKVPNMSGGT